LGFNYKYDVSKNLNLNFGYNFSKTFNVFNNSDEKISFNTHQFQFGLLFYLF
jgi:opacity protein-like surface antigen